MNLLCLLLNLYLIALFGRIILSWFPIEPGTPMASVYSFLFRITEPVLGPLRRVLPLVRLGGLGIDLAPIVAIVALWLLAGIICR